MLALEGYVRKSSRLEPSLLELVRMRASQINGCAYCLDMHSKDARANGESEQRLYALSAWRETPFFTDREQAALAWTEAVTLVSHNTVHLSIIIALPMSMGGRGAAWRGRKGKLLILRLTPRGLRRWRLETTRSSRISSRTAS
jgi:AhpD family alkylhydroperoxidase